MVVLINTRHLQDKLKNDASYKWVAISQGTDPTGQRGRESKC